MPKGRVFDKMLKLWFYKERPRSIIYKKKWLGPKHLKDISK